MLLTLRFHDADTLLRCCRCYCFTPLILRHTLSPLLRYGDADAADATPLLLIFSPLDAIRYAAY